jgi:hypothetical protein
MRPEAIEPTVSNAEGGLMAGISLGGLIVILGILIAIFWSLWIGIIIALVGLLAFGGFARGRWY